MSSSTFLQNFWGQSLRPFFLSGALFGCLSLVAWLGSLQGWWFFNPIGGTLWWHAHEMLFGFVPAFIVGFLLTSTQKWTGKKGLHGLPLAFLWLFWLVPRVGFAFASKTWHLHLMVLELLFLPLAVLALALPLLSHKQYRNLMIVPVLLLMNYANYLSHQKVLESGTASFQQGFYSMVMLILVVVTLIAGRVIPAFTFGALKKKMPPFILWLEAGTMALTLSCALLYLFGPSSSPLLVPLLLLTSLFHLIKISYWKTLSIWKIPLLLTLHLSYLALPIGLILLALSLAYPSLFFASDALHAFTVGVMGTMIFAVAIRVSVVGQDLWQSKWFSFCLLLIYTSFLLRVFTRVIGLNYGWGLILATLCWCIAYLSFMVFYAPIFCRLEPQDHPPVQKTH